MMRWLTTRKTHLKALLLPTPSLRFEMMVCSSMHVMFGIFNLGGGEIILILALILIMFGAKKLPELAKGLGQGIKEFKKATKEVTDEVTNAMDETPSPTRRLPSSPPSGTVTNVESSSTPAAHVETSQTVPQTTASGSKP
jgi:sec-independent protein translocase protein TatA